MEQQPRPVNWAPYNTAPCPKWSSCGPEKSLPMAPKPCAISAGASCRLPKSKCTVGCSTQIVLRPPVWSRHDRSPMKLTRPRKWPPVPRMWRLYLTMRLISLGQSNPTAKTCTILIWSLTAIAPRGRWGSQLISCHPRPVILRAIYWCLCPE